MRAVNFFRQIPTRLSLNGPNLSITDISDIIVNSGHPDPVTFTATATATFPTQTPLNTATINGTLSYRWYIEGTGAISDGTYFGATFSGTGTNTLQIQNLTNPTANNLRIFLRATFTPAGYTNSQDTSTPNALNGPYIDSNIAVITVRPFISIITQPQNLSISENRQGNVSVAATVSDGTIDQLSYQWILNGNNLSNSDTISGATTPNLSISLPDVGDNTLQVSISHPEAGNAPLLSEESILTITPARSVIRYEIVGDASFANTAAISGDYNLIPPSIGGSGPITFRADRYSYSNPTHVLYSPERDIRVKITLAGSRGGNGRNTGPSEFGSGQPGGWGGVSTFYFVLKKQVEYAFKIGFSRDTYDSRPSSLGPMGGSGGNTLAGGDGADGGGGTFFYERSRLIACVGGGGGGGRRGRGGDGGGVYLPGTPAGRDVPGVAAQGGFAINYGNDLPTARGSNISDNTPTDRRPFGGVPSSGSDSIGKVGSCTYGSDTQANNYQLCSDTTGVRPSNDSYYNDFLKSDDGSNTNSPNQSLQQALDRIALGRDSRIRPRWTDQFLLQNRNTTNLIVRGFKPGDGGRNNGGWAYTLTYGFGFWQPAPNAGGGGGGAVGGRSGGVLGGGAGGGGGSGYLNPIVIQNAVIRNQIGGNSGIEGYVTIEYASDEEWENRFGNTYDPQ